MASQRPPAWFRLSSMRAAAPPPPAPAPAPAPAPVRPIRPPPPVVRPAVPFRPPPPPPPPPTQPQEPTAPPSPVAPPPPRSPVAPPAPRSPVPPPKSPVAPPPRPTVAAPPSPPPPAPQPSPQRESVKSPTPPPSSPVTKATVTTQQPSPPSSKAAETDKAPVPSPKNVKPWENSSPAQFPVPNPPSPLSLPPPQIIEQKKVLVQETIDKPMKTHTNGISSKGKRQIPAATKDKKASSDSSEESGMRVITIAGENRGAVMEISKKNQPLNKTNGQQGKSESTMPVTTFLNSNIQGINNSIVFNTKCHHNDPGIHLSLVTKPRHNHSSN